tara:strand:+ start:1873 stop:2748 length:876 start_codon:yes stop_codon:yes gene_type:complete
MHSTSNDYKIIYKYLTESLKDVTLQKDVMLVGPATSEETFNSIDYNKKIVIFLCTEVMARRDFQKQRSYIHKSHIIVTGSPNEDVPENFTGKVFVIPAFFMWIDFTNTEIIHAIKGNVCYSLKEREGICFIARDDVGKNRRRMLRYFINNNIDIDCPSKIGHNCSTIESRNMTKMQFLENYIFNLCPENTYYDGYATEKIFDACISGCIPLYFGNGIRHFEKILNMNRVIITNTGFKTHQYGDMLKQLNNLKNKENLEKFFYQPVFQENAYDEIKKLFDKIEEIKKYICEI